MADADSNAKQGLGELVELTKAYAKQETVDPIKGLGKFVGYGLGAAILGSVSVVLLLVGLLRLIQMETGVHLTGHLSWVPYLITLVLSVILVAIAASAIKAKKGSNL